RGREREQRGRKHTATPSRSCASADLVVYRVAFGEHGSGTIAVAGGCLRKIKRGSLREHRETTSRREIGKEVAGASTSSNNKGAGNIFFADLSTRTFKAGATRSKRSSTTELLQPLRSR
ncbi:hypothetical protein PIB30_063533, partial [Stylosanthes scabra]|nr:hypothetical protein [Stylosanthes scabra]